MRASHIEGHLADWWRERGEIFERHQNGNRLGQVGFHIAATVQNWLSRQISLVATDAQLVDRADDDADLDDVPIPRQQFNPAVLTHRSFSLLADGRIMRGDREVASPPYYMENAVGRLTTGWEPRLDIECWRSTREGMVMGGNRFHTFDIYFDSKRDAWKWLHALERFPPPLHPHDLWPVFETVFGFADGSKTKWPPEWLHAGSQTPIARYYRPPIGLDHRVQNRQFYAAAALNAAAAPAAVQDAASPERRPERQTESRKRPSPMMRDLRLNLETGITANKFARRTL